MMGDGVVGRWGLGGIGWIARVARGLERDGLATAPAGVLSRVSGSGGEHARVWAKGWRGEKGEGQGGGLSARAAHARDGVGTKVALSRHEVHEALVSVRVRVRARVRANPNTNSNPNLGERVVEAVRTDCSTQRSGASEWVCARNAQGCKV